jgi:hypothetical protein
VPLTSERRIQVKVFWDTKDIRDGSNWRDVFLEAVRHSCLFLPIVSEAGIAPIKEVRPSDAKMDNVLLEYETAIQQQKRKLTAILPLLVGQRIPAENRFARFSFEQYGGHLFPATGSVTSPAVPICETMTGIFSNQGLLLSHVTDDGDMFCHHKLTSKGGGVGVSFSEGVSVADRVVQVMRQREFPLFSFSFLWHSLFFFRLNASLCLLNF